MGRRGGITKAEGIRDRTRETVHTIGNQHQIYKEVLQAGGWQMRILEEGYRPKFQTEPWQYKEKNNRSAEQNMDTVREKVKEWQKEGYVTRRQTAATCTNLLSVAVKIDSETGEAKKRVVLDLSRHVNRLAQPQHVALDDL